MQGSEPPQEQRGVEHLLAMLSAQMTAAGRAEEGQEGQDAQQHEAMHPGQTLPSMDALEEGAPSSIFLLQIWVATG